MTIAARPDGRIPVCYLAPWLDYGGSDKGTIDWFRWLDRDRFAPLLVTTQPSGNRRLAEVYAYADEVWALPEFLAGQHFPAFIFDLIHTRGVQVLHIMNSRIGYDLLPDLASLEKPPVVVVQLHVEEPDRSGYVRYVTTRYGNLIDAFSVSSEHLAQAMGDYDVSPAKLRVIPTGVDSEGEFNPARVRPSDAVQPNGFNILFPGRLTEQKNPLLMVDVIRRVVDVHHDVHVHVVGDGPLEPSVRARIRDAGLQRQFTFHPPSRELARWYAACDLLLMTSAFEGVPYVVYEAMAMALPIVAPALAGNVELMADTAGILVDPRDDVAAYAQAVGSLIEDRGRATALAQAGRKRVSENFSLHTMGELHARLYDDLLTSRAASARSSTSSKKKTRASDSGNGTSAARSRPASSPAAPLRFRHRPTRGQPLVSVVVPCFNHGHFLPQCLESIVDQDYEAIEVLVVDDASTDPATAEVLREVGSNDEVRVIRQPHNMGPSAARNRAIREAKGRYILPVDADNILLPGALPNLVEQLQAAGERVGYIYPNCQYFGTRDDYFVAPRFNLALLLVGNYCDTCSLIDREVFDAGLCYAEDIRVGHEDWDFVLTLATHGIRGESAHDRTLLYRKHGFTRSDAVEYAADSFHKRLPARHPELYGDPHSWGRFGRWRGPAAEIKARDSPGLSIVMTAPADFSSADGEQLLRHLQAQTCRDFELILECEVLPVASTAFSIRRIPPGLCESLLEVLSEGLALARASRVLVVGEELTTLFLEPTFAERLQRTFWASPALEAIAFADAGEGGHFPYRLLEDGETDSPAQALAWRVEAQQKLPDALLVQEAMPAESIARAMSVKGVEMQWRHAIAHPSESSGGQAWLDLAAQMDAADPRQRTERAMTAKLPPALPALPWDAVPRWLRGVSWMPPETELLTRHRELDGERRILKWGRGSPPGFTLEYDLGSIHRFSPPGTVRLVQGARGIRTLPRGSARSEEDEELGHLELAPLPLLEPVERAVLADGSETLVGSDRDELCGAAVKRDFLGFIEAFPNGPVLPPDSRRSFHGVVGLLRCVDHAARRHVYRIDGAGEDELVVELGALHLTAERGSIAVWLDGDRRVVTRGIPEAASPEVGRVLRWVVAPAGWRGFGHVRGRARSIMRRGIQATERMQAEWGERSSSRFGSRAPISMSSAPVGYLYPEAAPGRRELFAATHPVTGDQLLTQHPLEAADMGYGNAVSLGYVLDQAPVTGTLAARRVSIPWASRFGLAVRRA